MLMMLFFILEVASFMIGGITGWADTLLPEGIDTSDTGIVIGFLNWLYVGRVPLLMLLIIFLTVFGVFGLTLQYIIYIVTNQLLPSLIAVPIVLMGLLPVIRWLAKWLYKILPQDETTAIHSDELVGRVGTIVIGTATTQQAAQAKVKDLHGQTHCVMVIADDEPLTQGQSVLLIAKESAQFRAISNPNALLTDL